MEVQLRILHYALTSRRDIIDPLSKPRVENITAAEKATRENQFAIGVLATCKAFHTEGNRILWGNNTFTFTTHSALRNFAKLDLKYRQGIKAVNLRIIAKYYDDDEPVRTRKISRFHHTSMKKDVALKIHPRHRENDQCRKGFRVYAWAQVTDFLHALGPPHQPGCDKADSRPRLLPSLDAMRIDFVNFFAEWIPTIDLDFHEATVHDNGCTLSELMITGMPCNEMGLRASAECSGMVRNSGLFIDACPAFIQLKTLMKPLKDTGSCKRVVRAWNVDGQPGANGHSHHLHARHNIQPVIDEPDAPKTVHKRPTVWRRVPVTRDSTQREWVEFDRKRGFTVTEMESDLGVDMEDSVISDDEDDEDDPLNFDIFDPPFFPVCAKCGDVHPIWD